MLKKIMATTVALSLVAAPAFAQSAASAPAPASETVEGSRQLEGGAIIAPIIAGAIVIFGILLATETWPFDDDDEDPVSP